MHIKLIINKSGVNMQKKSKNMVSDTNISITPKNKDKDSIKNDILTHLKYSLSKDRYSETKLDAYVSAAMTVMDFLAER
jgi:hypothetical protein